MEYKGLFIGLLVIGLSNAQLYKVCVPSSDQPTCQSLDLDGSLVTCLPVASRLECAIRMARGEADIGAFTEEELILMGQMQPTGNQIIASIREQSRLDVPFSFEAVAIVPNNHSNGLEGLKGGRYCHPGFDMTEMRWSPRVLKALEQGAARTDRCPNADVNSKTAEELEVETLSNFFSAACRPGSWSFNTTVDTDLKRRFPNLCSMCANGACGGYNTDNAVSVSGVNNNNRHIQALDCLVTNGTVAYVAWQHVREFFTYRNPQHTDRYAVLCPDSTIVQLTTTLLTSTSSPCAIVRQPWRAIVASNNNAANLRTQLSTWWPNGAAPEAGTWQSTLYQVLVGGTNFRVTVESLNTPLNYTSSIRPISSMSSSTSCLPAVRWCTVSNDENTKCLWLSVASYVLGLEPQISCERRADTFQCLRDISDNRADFFSVDTHYGYIARRHYRLSPVKLVQNARASASRVAAFVKESATQANVTRFENLRDKVACFPEYGGIAYVAFVRAAHERSIISSLECDYARAVGEFFSGACAPGALDVSHALSDSSDFNSTILCSACRPLVNLSNSFTCAWDYTNLYYGNNGSVACLADVNTDVAFLETQNLTTQMAALNLDPMNYRALCRNNTLAINSGINIDDGCLLAYVVDAEVLTRRNDVSNNAINTLLDGLDRYFGSNVALNEALINLVLYSPFDGKQDLLFKDTTIGLTEATTSVSHEPAKNYMEMISHLNTCTGAATPGPAPGVATRTMLSIVVLLVAAVFSRLF